MKVIQINFSAGGSTGKIASALHSFLLSKRESAYFANGRGKSNLDGSFRIGNELDFRLHTYVSRLTGLHGYYSHVNTYKLINSIREIDPDIIHLHNLHGDYINIGKLFSFLKSSRAKIIVTLHDCWLFTGGCAHYTTPFCDDWKRECGHCKRRMEYPKSYIFDTSKKCLKDKKRWFSYRDDINIVAVSNWLKEQAEQSLLSKFKVQTIYNGVDEKTFYPKKNANQIRMKYGISDNKKIILGVASVWSPNKGLNDFINLRSQLEENIEIVLVGLNKEQLSGLPSCVVGIERTENQDELAMIYSLSDLLINFSKEETFGMVAAEAMACGTPVIVSNTTACPEIVDSMTGYAFDLSNTPLLEQRIGELLARDRNEISQKCVSRVDMEFSSKKMVNEYYKLYSHIMEDARK